jgi:hypothetical protein
MILNDNYRIVYDTENVILQFFEPRIKRPKEGAIQDCGMTYEFIENSYYPSLKSALNGFLVKCTWGLDTAEEILKELNRVEQLIKQVTWK